MSAIVTVDTVTGVLNRYEIGGAEPRHTHQGIFEQIDLITRSDVEYFRSRPPLEFCVDRGGPKPPPTTGGTPAAKRAA